MCVPDGTYIAFTPVSLGLVCWVGHCMERSVVWSQWICVWTLNCASLSFKVRKLVHFPKICFAVNTTRNQDHYIAEIVQKKNILIGACRCIAWRAPNQPPSLTAYYCGLVVILGTSAVTLRWALGDVRGVLVLLSFRNLRDTLYSWILWPYGEIDVYISLNLCNILFTGLYTRASEVSRNINDWKCLFQLLRLGSLVHLLEN